MNDSRITREEMVELFGVEMPIEAVTLLADAPCDWTLAQLRERLREIAGEEREDETMTSEWQPIETAPKDGTGVLVWFDAATVPVVHIAWYRSAKEWEESGQYCGGWETLEEWEGWWSYTRGSVTQERLEGYSAPTHWIPLPEPPLS